MKSKETGINRLDFTDKGKIHTEGKEEHWRKIFEDMVWNEFEDDQKVPMMPGMAINQIIEDMNRKPLRWSISHDAAPFGLVGVEFKYKDAIVKSYWLDDGTRYTCLASAPTFTSCCPHCGGDPDHKPLSEECTVRMTHRHLIETGIHPLEG